MRIEMASKIGVGPNSLYITLSRNPTVDKLERIAAALGVDIVELFVDEKSSVITCPACGARLFVEKFVPPAPAPAATAAEQAFNSELNTP